MLHLHRRANANATANADSSLEFIFVLLHKHSCSPANPDSKESVRRACLVSRRRPNAPSKFDSGQPRSLTLPEATPARRPELGGFRV